MEAINFLKKWYHLIFLLFLIFFHGIINYFWINNNNTYYFIDDYYHLTFSTKIYRILFSDGHDFNFIGTGAFYQRPLIPLITAIVLYPIFGVGANVAIMINIIFLAILIFSTYLIGKKIHNKNTGLVAAFLLSMYPIVFSISRYYTYFIGLTAMLSLSVCFLLLSDKFRNRKYSLLFGLSSGIGILVNIFFIILVVGPVLYTIFSSIRNSRKNERIKIYSNICISFLICFLIAGIWNIYCIFKYDYFNNLSKTLFSKTLFSKTLFFQEENIIYRYFQFFKFSFIYYLEGLVNNQIFLTFFILFCIGLFFYIKSKNKNIILLLWLIIPYLIVSIKIFKRPIYIFPILPAIAIFSTFWIFRLRKKTLQKYIVLFILLFGFTQFFIISHSTFLSNSKLFGFKIEGYTNPPSKFDWKEKEIVTYMMNNTEKRPVKAIFLIPLVSEYYISKTGTFDVNLSPIFFNPLIYTYYSTLHELPVEIYPIYNYSEVYDLISSIDFLMVTRNYVNMKNMDEYVNIKTINETISNLKNFYPAKNFLLPNNDEIIIFKKYG